MIAPSTAALFLLVVLAGAMTPGPDFVMVTRSALLPQFLPHSASTLATLSLAAVGAVASVTWWVTVAMVVGSLRRIFAAPRVRRAMDGIMGTLLLGLGLRVAVD